MNTNKEISVIIPTYNRANDLKEALDSIFKQTVLPKEIIVVDDSENNETRNLIKSIRESYQITNEFLKVISKSGERSLTSARNLGVNFSSGKIILFLDDDVILDETYIAEILKIYTSKKDVNGVQGYIYTQYRKPVIDKHKIFYLNHSELNKCRLLPSTQNTSPYQLTKTITCQWLSGSNQSYRRDIFQEFQFDENLRKYSYKEDMDFSYRVYKKYPNSLYMTPFARLIHKTSSEARTPDPKMIIMNEVYSFYFFYKNIDQTFKNKLIFWWSRLGPIIINLYRLSWKPSKPQLIEIINLTNTYLFCIKNLKFIKRRDLNFFNKRLY